MSGTKEIDKVALISIQDGKILSTRSYGKERYYIPGGKREAGETDAQTLAREILEELSVNIIPATMNYVGTFKAQADGHNEGIVVKMTCYKAEFEGTLEANNEIEEIRWLTYKDLGIISEVDKRIFTFFKENGELR